MPTPTAAPVTVYYDVPARTGEGSNAKDIEPSVDMLPPPLPGEAFSTPQMNKDPYISHAKRIKRNISVASQNLSEDDNFLVKLKEEENLAWKDIATRFQIEKGKNFQVTALQMRYIRLRAKFRFWEEQDVLALKLAHEYWQKYKWEIISAKMLDFGIQERWPARLCARKWQEVEAETATLPASTFSYDTIDPASAKEMLLNRHKREELTNIENIKADSTWKYCCDACSRCFAREQDLKRHLEEVHQAQRSRSENVPVSETSHSSGDTNTPCYQDVADHWIFEDTDMVLVPDRYGIDDIPSSQTQRTKDPEGTPGAGVDDGKDPCLHRVAMPDNSSVLDVLLPTTTDRKGGGIPVPPHRDVLNSGIVQTQKDESISSEPSDDQKQTSNATQPISSEVGAPANQSTKMHSQGPGVRDITIAVDSHKSSLCTVAHDPPCKLVLIALHSKIDQLLNRTQLASARGSNHGPLSKNTKNKWNAIDELRHRRAYSEPLCSTISSGRSGEEVRSVLFTPNGSSCSTSFKSLFSVGDIAIHNPSVVTSIGENSVAKSHSSWSTISAGVAASGTSSKRRAASIDGQGQPSDPRAQKRQHKDISLSTCDPMRLKCIFHVGERHNFPNDTTTYSHISQLQRHLRGGLHYFFACSKCFEQFDDANALRHHLKQNPCVKSCSRPACRRYRSASIAQQATCSCIMTANDQWLALYKLKYGDAPLEELDDQNSTVAADSDAFVLVNSDLNWATETRLRDENLGFPVVKAEDTVLSTTEYGSSEPALHHLENIEFDNLGFDDTTFCSLLELAKKIAILEERLSVFSQVPSRPQSVEGLLLGIVWQAFAKTNSPETWPGSPLYKMMASMAPDAIPSAGAQSQSSGDALFSSTHQPGFDGTPWSHFGSPEAGTSNNNVTGYESSSEPLSRFSQYSDFGVRGPARRM